MQRVKTADAVAVKPAYTITGTPGFFSAGDAVAARDATVPGPQWFNMVQEELLAVLEAAGLVPSAMSDTQLRDAILALIATDLDAHDVDEEAHADIRALIAGLSGARYESMWLGAGAMIPSKTNGATAATVEGANYKLVSDMLTFSASVDQSAQAVLALPDNWDRGAIAIKVHWLPAAAGATAGQHVGWLVSGGAVGDGDVVDRALGASATVDDQVLAGLETVEHISAASAAITLGGDPQVGDRLHLKIERDADYAGAGTAMPVLAGLLGLEIQYRVTGAVAAWE